VHINLVTALGLAVAVYFVGYLDVEWLVQGECKGREEKGDGGEC
jgi:hypothetical protein